MRALRLDPQYQGDAAGHSHRYKDDRNPDEVRNQKAMEARYDPNMAGKSLMNVEIDPDNPYLRNTLAAAKRPSETAAGQHPYNRFGPSRYENDALGRSSQLGAYGEQRDPIRDVHQQYRDAKPDEYQGVERGRTNANGPNRNTYEERKDPRMYAEDYHGKTGIADRPFGYDIPAHEGRATAGIMRQDNPRQPRQQPGGGMHGSDAPFGHDGGSPFRNAQR